MPVYTTLKCISCKETVTRANVKTGLYCSKKCSDKHKHDQWIKEWLCESIDMEKTYSGPDNTISAHIRRYLFEEYDNKCCKCGWSEINPKTMKVPLQVNHIDGDSTNNSRDNLELICPNCHSLTPTYGRFGKGRKNRYKAGVAQG